MMMNETSDTVAVVELANGQQHVYTDNGEADFAALGATTPEESRETMHVTDAPEENDAPIGATWSYAAMKKLEEWM